MNWRWLNFPDGLPMPANWLEAQIVGERRQRLREATAGTSPRGNPDEPEHENVVGVVAEFALARVIHYPVPCFYVDWENDPGWDFDTPVGRVDIKGCAKKPWFLPVSDAALAKQPGADFYCLVWCPDEGPDQVQRECLLVGFATRAQMDAGEHVDNIFDPDHERDYKNPTPGRILRIRETPLYPARAIVGAIVNEDELFMERLQWKSSSTKTAWSTSAPGK